jgi:hypothetical protein
MSMYNDKDNRENRKVYMSTCRNKYNEVVCSEYHFQLDPVRIRIYNSMSQRRSFSSWEVYGQRSSRKRSMGGRSFRCRLWVRQHNSDVMEIFLVGTDWVFLKVLVNKECRYPEIDSTNKNVIIMDISEGYSVIVFRKCFSIDHIHMELRSRQEDK